MESLQRKKEKKKINKERKKERKKKRKKKILFFRAFDILNKLLGCPQYRGQNVPTYYFIQWLIKSGALMLHS